ncbi:hypothetical protein Bbelb_346980 [Branchiostoma belcheri]|nr:hypothetical protein Bbelb_346980 [Branchiostoma belcheri]
MIDDTYPGTQAKLSLPTPANRLQNQTVLCYTARTAAGLTRLLSEPRRGGCHVSSRLFGFPRVWNFSPSETFWMREDDSVPTVPADPRASDRHSAPSWRRCGPRRSIPSARNPSFGPLNRRPSVSQTSRKRPSGRQSYTASRGDVLVFHVELDGCHRAQLTTACRKLPCVRFGHVEWRSARRLLEPTLVLPVTTRTETEEVPTPGRYARNNPNRARRCADCASSPRVSHLVTKTCSSRTV